MRTSAHEKPPLLAAIAVTPLGTGRWRLALLVLAGSLLLLLIGQAATVETLVQAWSRSAIYRMSWLVLPALGYLLWLHRHRLAATPPAPTWLGVLAALAAAALWLAADVININAGRQAALVAATGAVVLAAVGWRATLRLLPFLALLVFVVPTGTLMLEPLKHVAVAIVEGFGTLFGLPVETQTFVVYVGAHRYVVIDDCAGLPFLWIGLFLGLFFGLLLFRTPWKIAALTVTGGLFGIAANSLRIIAILVADWIDGTQMELAGHVPFQWLTLGLTVALMLALVALLRPDPAEPALQPGPESEPAVGAAGSEVAAGASSRPAFIWPLLAAAVVASAPHLVPAAPQAPRVASMALTLPDVLVDWTRAAQESDWRPVAAGDVAQLGASYDLGDERITVFVVEAMSPEGKVSGDAVDLIGDRKWMTADTGLVEACTADRCLPVRHLRLVLRQSPRVRHVYATFSLGDRVVASPLTLRLLRGWTERLGEPAHARLVAVATENPTGLSVANQAVILDTLARLGR
jgi:exosortase